MKAEITYAINKDGIIYNTKSQIFGNCWHDIKIREIEGNGAYLVPLPCCRNSELVRAVFR